MRERTFLTVCWIAVPLLSAANQGCMKLLATLVDAGSWVSAIHSPYLFAILFCEILSLFLWLRVLAVMPVSRAVPITAIAYVLVLMLGWFGFAEPMQPEQLIGSAFILSGVWLLSTPSSKKIPLFEVM